ncbi:MAG TPA: ABC transporter ATP-binding protein [Devosiaceae bacterium]|nr:ABC transporter ATP-binding protein [Devosiaceae bacterium]
MLSVTGLTVEFGTAQHPLTVVDSLSFSVERGRTLAIVGESGSGKSMTALSAMGLVGHVGARISAGHILFSPGDSKPLELTEADDAALRKVRGKDIAMIFQEPMTSLNPVFTVGNQIAEVLKLHEGMSKANAFGEAQRLLELVRLPDAKETLSRYPHQLSGGMRQRVMIAMALACRPKLLIADEPTTALDVTIQAQILNIIRDLQEQFRMAVIFITHDMGVVAEMADDVVVMWRGKKVEQAPVKQLFGAPSHPYTRMLLGAMPRLGSLAGQKLPKRLPVTVMEDGAPRTIGEEHIQDTADYAKPLLEVEKLYTRFDVKRTLLGRVTHRVHSVEGVSFDIFPGETLALVGESGSGKSTIGRSIQNLVKPTSGQIKFGGIGTAGMTGAQRALFRQKVQYIFQDPFASLDPRKTVRFSIAEPIRTHGLIADEKAIARRVDELLEQVGLPTNVASRYPHEFSGGQRQRICIARALASEPQLIIADEPLSALDVSIQAQVVNLFMELQERFRLSYLFISHDVAVVERISHRIAVLYLGQIVEIGSRSAVLEHPQHPYTRRLLSAVPSVAPGAKANRALIEGEIPSAIRAVGDEPAPLALSEVSPGHLVAGRGLDGWPRPQLQNTAVTGKSK